MDTKKIMMHTLINILVNYNNFIEKHVSLQDIILENLPKKSYQ
jgi:hypothetical protein